MPRHFLKQFEGLKTLHAMQAIVATGVVGLFYWLSTVVPTGPISWLVAIPADIIIALTALARLNDMPKDQTSKRSQVRRLGFLMAGVAAVGYIGIALGGPPQYPPWKSVMLQWGVALAWLTTPGMPPWWRYISGDYRKKEIKDGSI